MALPVLSTNQPVAGSIAWTAFSITYNGVSYAIAAGNTGKKFVWWQYNGGTSPAVMSADVLPSLAVDDMLLFLNKNGVGVLVPYTDVIEGSLIVSGSILAAAIGADQIVASHIATDAVTAKEIKAGAVEAQHLSAGAVTTSKLSVGSVGDNAVANGSFEDLTEGWIHSEGNGISDVVTGVSSSGANALRLVRNTVNQGIMQAPAFFIPVSGINGTKWYISARAGAATTLSGGFYLRVRWYLGDKVTVASVVNVDVVTNRAVSAAWELFEGQVVPPADARYMAIEVINVLGTSTIYVDEISALEVTVSAQIADGAITTPKIVVGSLNGDRITANTINADRIIANTISTTQLTVGVANSITTAQTDATNAGTTATAAKLLANAALIQDSASSNPIFERWTGSYPDGYGGWSGGGSRETSITRTGAAARFKVLTTTDEVGFQFYESLHPKMANFEYITVTIDVYLVSGAFGRAGVIVDWAGLPNAFSLVNLVDEIPSPELGKWYHVSKVVRRPANTSGTVTHIGGYLMGQWSGHTGPGTIKDIVYDRMTLRAATTEEIAALDAQSKANAVTNLTNGWKTTGTTTIDGGKITADSITVASGVIGSLDAGKISTGFVKAAHIEAGSITITKLNDNVTIPLTLAQNTANAALIQDTSSINPVFADWTGTYPNGYGYWNATGTKETTLSRTGNAVRFAVTTTGLQMGFNFNESLHPQMANSEYVTVTVDVYLVSGTFGQAGVIVDWAGLSNNRTLLNLANEIPSPTVGKWYRVSKVLRRPINSGGTYTGMAGYLMGQWDGHAGGGAVKDIIFDRMTLRAATTEEIAALDAQSKANAVTELTNSWKTTGQTTINGGKITTDSVSAGVLKGDAINGMTITGATIRTAASGQRVELTSTGLKGYDAANAVKTSVGTDGLLTATDAIITGTMKTAATGQRAELTGTGVKFVSAQGFATTITAFDNGASGTALSLGGALGKLTVGTYNLPQGGSAEVSMNSAFVNEITAGTITVNGRNLGDTGWVNLTPTAGWTVVRALQYRVMNGVVYLSGLVQCTASATGTLTTLPVSAQGSKAYPIVFTQATSLSTAIRTTLNAGALGMMLNTGAYYYMDGISFPA